MGDSCNSICYLNGTQLQCDLSSCDGPSTAWAVTRFNGGATDISAFGTCNGEDFCCPFTDNGQVPLTDVAICGSGYTDTLGFSYDDSGTVSDLRPYTGGQNLSSRIAADGGDDNVTGSDFAGSSYGELLCGGLGGDTMAGQSDSDWIVGDSGNDIITGGAGNDRIWGGDGSDTIEGAGGNDLICETGADLGNGCPVNLMHGNGGSDVLWLDYDGTCGSSALDPLSTCGTDNDRFGDSNNFTLPADCDVPITTEPPPCSPAPFCVGCFNPGPG